MTHEECFWVNPAVFDLPGEIFNVESFTSWFKRGKRALA